MPPHGRRLFEGLGLDQPQPQEINPLQTLGVDRGFAQELLGEDRTGATVKLVVHGLYRALARVYHTDVVDSNTQNAERFNGIVRAHDRVAEASPQELARWAKPDRTTGARPASSSQTQKSNARAEIATDMVRSTMELGNNPLHFSQFQWSQGALLVRDKRPLLLQNDPGNGDKRLLPGEAVHWGSRQYSALHEAAVGTLRHFMEQYTWFGLPPDSRIVLYVDERARASILNPDMSFLMDVSQPLRAFDEAQIAAGDKSESFWAHGVNPALITTRISGAAHADDSDTRVTTFPVMNGGRDMSQDMRMNVAGSTSDAAFFKVVRHQGAGATALRGASAKGSYFSAAPASVTEMIDRSAGYSPLVLPGNSLVFYDASLQKPLATDLRILGMLGNGAQKA